MTEFKRDFFKQDPVMHKLFMIIKGQHKAGDHDAKILFENRHTKDFCVMSRYFMVMPGNPGLYIHYDTASWYNGSDGALVRIEAIGVYDDFMEYERARVKELHGAKPGDADIPNVN